MKIAIIIPARYGSTRLPGKPLAVIAGTSMIERVWRIASSVKNIHEVWVATDDTRIADAVTAFGGKAVMTDPHCPNGTIRCHDAVQKSGTHADFILNLQGDAPLTPPWVLQSLVDSVHQHPEIQMVTPAVALNWQQRQALIEAKRTTPGSGTTVVVDRHMNALYFSKLVLPYFRDEPKESEKADAITYRHIGLYGYHRSVLEHYMTLPETKLENAEKLEQLRLLYHGIPIRIVPVDFKGRSQVSVDSPEDIIRAEKVIASEGELL